MSKKRVSQDTTEYLDEATGLDRDLSQEELEREMEKIREEMGVTDERSSDVYSTLEVITDEFGYQDELVLADAKDNLYSLYLAPDGSGVVVQPITLSITRHPHKVFPVTESGDLPWRQIDHEIFPGGFTQIDVGDTAKEASSNRWKRIVSKLLSGVSYRDHYLAVDRKNPYIHYP